MFLPDLPAESTPLANVSFVFLLRVSAVDSLKNEAVFPRAADYTPPLMFRFLDVYLPTHKMEIKEA